MDNNVPSDPISTPNANVNAATGYNYAYFSSSTVSYCGGVPNQVYMLTYRMETNAQVNTLNGNCASSVLAPYASISNWRMTRI
jgi:hypothetical protein